MDNNNDNDIEQFLIDVREHFRASLETSEYENTSNMFHVTEAETTERLLQRCESLLHRCLNKKRFCKQAASLPVSPTKALIGSDSELAQQQQEPDSVSYMDMSANGRRASAILPLGSEDLTSSTHSDKTFRCSTRITTKAKHLDQEAAIPSTNHQLNQHASDQEEFPDDMGDGGQIYDICHVTHQELQPTDETQMVSNADMELIPSPDCPYKDLAAAHLGIQKPSKYGQLQRIEKRLFFDQSKKCYCGILEDWLLVYADGPTAGAPAHTLYLKTPGIEIEHSGEGKRRDVCFQITTADPNKKFIFQAANEVDAKEWIHAIEAAIRGVTAAGVLIAPATATINASSPSNKSLRKLPTPPIIKKMNFLGSGHSSHSINISNSNDCIYEEPSPLYEIQDQLGELPEKFNSPAALAKKYEYDVPKCPAKPLVEPLVESEQETSGLLNATPTEGSNSKDSPSPQVVTEKSSDFQAKIKDVHSKLSSQLSAGPLKKAVVSKKTAYSHAPTQDSELLPPPVIVLPPPQVSTPLKEQKSSKKEKKSPATTPTSSPQKFMPLPSSGNSGSSGGCGTSPQQTSEKTPSKNWFLNRLNKSTSSMRSSSNNGGTGGNLGSLSNSSSPQHKGKQSEKENLLNGLDFTDSVGDSGNPGDLNNSSKPTSPVMRCAGGKSKVNMIINQLEASGHLATMFSVESLANSFSAAFCESDCNNYEPIMTVSPPPSSFLKKV